VQPPPPSRPCPRCSCSFGSLLLCRAALSCLAPAPPPSSPPAPPQFYFTLASDLDSLDEKHTVFGEVAEGEEVLDALNEAYCDAQGRPWVNIRLGLRRRGQGQLGPAAG
jgi:hypothetical protein